MRFATLALFGAAATADNSLYSSPAVDHSADFSSTAAVVNKLRSGSAAKVPNGRGVVVSTAPSADQSFSKPDESVSSDMEDVGGDAVHPTGVAGRSKSYSYEGNDYPGADHGVLLALPQRPVGTLPPFEQEIEEPELVGDADIVQSNHAIDIKRKWDAPRQMQPYYEWMIAQARGNRYSFPEPTVQLLEQLEQMLEDFNRGNVREIEVVRRGLQAAAGAAGAAAQNALSAGAQSAANAGQSVANAAGNAANAAAGAAGSVANAAAGNAAGGLPSLDADSVNNLFNVISNSMANVASAAGQAVGVPTTTPPPINQAFLGLLSILQGFQKLAVAAGSVGVNQIVPASA